MYIKEHFQLVVFTFLILFSSEILRVYPCKVCFTWTDHPWVGRPERMFP